jgi:hypothetical protein
MKAKLGFTKRALILGGLLIGTAGVALASTPANARNFIGVDVGPLSVGIGSNEPDRDAAPPPAPAPAPAATYVAPPTTYVAPSASEAAPVPQSYVETPAVTSQAPVTTDQPRASTETTTTTYYNYPNETTTYQGYQPGLVPRGSETTTIYYPQ